MAEASGASTRISTTGRPVEVYMNSTVNSTVVDSTVQSTEDYSTVEPEVRILEVKQYSGRTFNCTLVSSNIVFTCKCFYFLEGWQGTLVMV